MYDDQYFLELAHQQALKAFQKDEVPIGAVLVNSAGQVIARAYNKVETEQSQIAHAEILVLKKAAGKTKNWRLGGCSLYVTLQPCMMCLGAIYLSRVSRIVYAAQSPKYGMPHEQSLGIYQNLHIVVQCIQYEPSQELLKRFFKNKRKSNAVQKNRFIKNKTGARAAKS